MPELKIADNQERELILRALISHAFECKDTPKLSAESRISLMAKKIAGTLSSVKSVRKAKKKKKVGPPIKRTNLQCRSREYLTVAEVKALIDAAKSLGRYGFRDSLLILMTYRHALRVSEVTDLRWDQVDFDQARLHVNRLKNGEPSVHYLEGDELRALRKLRRDQVPSPFVFSSERQGPLSANAVFKIVQRAGIEADLELSAHPHQLRHSKGYQLASEGVDTRAIQGYMGHKNIQHTVLYTQLSHDRYADCLCWQM